MGIKYKITMQNRQDKKSNKKLLSSKSERFKVVERLKSYRHVNGIFYENNHLQIIILFLPPFSLVGFITIFVRLANINLNKNSKYVLDFT